MNKKYVFAGVIFYIGLLFILSNKPQVQSNTTIKITHTPSPTIIEITEIPTVIPTLIPTEIPTIIPTAIPTVIIYIPPTNPPQEQATVNTNTGTSFTCNCAKTCNEMINCAEAYYQLNNCGCSRRDGDHDGIPCENICR